MPLTLLRDFSKSGAKQDARSKKQTLPFSVGFGPPFIWGKGWPAEGIKTRVSIAARAARCGQGLTRLFPTRRSAWNTIARCTWTGCSGDQTEDYYLRRGALGFLRKPIHGDALLDLLDSIA